MDSSWGIVIVAVVSSIGTVVGVKMANGHSAKLAADQRRADATTQQRARLMEAFTAYMAAVERVEASFWRDLTLEGYSELRLGLDVRETHLSVMGNPAIATAARELSTQYGTSAPLPNPDPERQRLKDHLTETVRTALMEV